MTWSRSRSLEACRHYSLKVEKVFSIIIVAIIALSFFNLKLGTAFYVAYLMLVPFLQVRFGPLSLSYNFTNLLFFIVWLFNYRGLHKKRIDTKAINPFFFYFLCLLLVIPLQWQTPFSAQLDYFRQDIMSVLLVPIIIWNILIRGRNSQKLFEGTMIVCILVAGIYGLVLTLMPGINPYIMMITDLFGGEFNSIYALAEGEGRLFGRISSVFLHPMTFGLFLGLSAIFLFYLWISGSWNKVLLGTAFGVVLVNLVTCGVRSSIAGVAVAFLYYVLKMRKFKLALASGTLMVIVLLIFGLNSDLGLYLGSITNSNGGEVRGSSLSMRFEQLAGAFEEIKNSFLFGKGYGWTQYYSSTFGDHPVMYAFESLFYVVLCNQGIFGLFVWGGFVYLTIKFNKRLARRQSAILNSLFFFYLAYALITGEYHYMRYYIVFYVIMAGRALSIRRSLSQNTQRKHGRHKRRIRFLHSHTLQPVKS